MAETAMSAEVRESLKAMSWFDSVDFSDGGSSGSDSSGSGSGSGSGSDNDDDDDDDGDDGEECDRGPEKAPAPGADAVDSSTSSEVKKELKHYLRFLRRGEAPNQKQQQQQRRRHSMTAAAPSLATILDNESYEPPPQEGLPSFHVSCDARMFEDEGQIHSAADGADEGPRSRGSRSSRSRRKHGSGSGSGSGRSKKKRSGSSSSGSSSRSRKSSSSSRPRKSSSSSRSRRKDGSRKRKSHRSKDGRSSRSGSRRKRRSSRSGRKEPVNHSVPADGDGRGGDDGRGGGETDLAGHFTPARLETIKSGKELGGGGEGGGKAGETSLDALKAYSSSDPFGDGDEVGPSQPQDDVVEKCAGSWYGREDAVDHLAPAADGGGGDGGGGAAPSEPEDDAAPPCPSTRALPYTPPVDIVAASKIERGAWRDVFTGEGGAERKGPEPVSQGSEGDARHRQQQRQDELLRRLSFGPDQLRRIQDQLRKEPPQQGQWRPQMHLIRDRQRLQGNTQRSGPRADQEGGPPRRDSLNFISGELPGYYHLEEFAGQRALLRLEQELSDHSECHRRFSESTDGRAPPKLAMDRRKLAGVPQVKKSDLIIGEYLGRGTFCDAFEVTWLLPQQWSPQQWSSQNTDSTASMDDDEVSRVTEASMDSLALSCSNDLSLIGGNEGLVRRRSFSQVRTATGERSASKNNGQRSLRDVLASMAEWRDDGGNRSVAPVDEGSRSARVSRGNPNVLALKCLRPGVRADPRNYVIGAEDLAHETALLASLSHPNIVQLHGRAEGCFSTAFLQGEHSDDSSKGGPGGEEKPTSSCEGYFIIIDRLLAVLPDRIDEWKLECQAIRGVAPPKGKSIQITPESTVREHLCKRLKVAYCVADAMEYLHSRSCVFRDLKPGNVGFDSNDCVKLFDFGFATSIAPLLSQPYDGYGPLTETCGTRRYMAPEVALKLGYGMEVDVHSFGLMLWEICAMEKPFEAVQSVDEFDELVMLCENRPSLNIDPLWTASLKNLMCLCWTTDPSNRPTMSEVKMMLCDVLRETNEAIEASPQNQRNAARKVENPFQRWWRSITM